MAKTLFDVAVRVDSQGLAKLAPHIEECGQLLNVHLVREGSSPRQQQEVGGFKHRQHHYANNKRAKGIKGPDLVLEILKSDTRPFSETEIGNRFVSRGFAFNSARPNLYMLKRDGKIRYLGNGMYCAIGTTIHMGAGAAVVSA